MGKQRQRRHRPDARDRAQPGMLVADGPVGPQMGMAGGLDPADLAVEPGDMAFDCGFR